jgi:hypothetical protein
MTQGLAVAGLARALGLVRLPDHQTTTLLT